MSELLDDSWFSDDIPPFFAQIQSLVQFVFVCLFKLGLAVLQRNNAGSHLLNGVAALLNLNEFL